MPHKPANREIGVPSAKKIPMFIIPISTRNDKNGDFSRNRK